MMAAEFIKECGLSYEGDLEMELNNIQLDSRKVESKDVFVAIKGHQDDGSKYISSAVDNGASLVLSDSPITRNDVPIIHVPELNKKITRMANVFYGNPIEKIKPIGVTGTNGKSTVTKLLTSVFKAGGKRVISLGTINNEIGDEIYAADLTTPNPVDLIAWIHKGVQKKCEVLIMEVSSHALAQHRVEAIPFQAAIFTNLTQDHLDYHETFENYFEAKKILFTDNMAVDGVSVVNIDNEYGKKLYNSIAGPKISFSMKEAADVQLTQSKLTIGGTEMELLYQGKTYSFSSSLVGQFNLENLLAVISCCLQLGLDSDVIQKGIESVVVPGRNERLEIPNGSAAIVDYAHTPDALERILISLRPLTQNRLICVFGCGGDRDKTKRPLMAKAAEENSDFVVVTSDNPRTEDPKSILQDTVAGIKNKKALDVIEDREQAINKALEMSQSGDCVVIAGKGHEDYQILGTEKVHFSDKEVVEEWINNKDFKGEAIHGS